MKPFEIQNQIFWIGALHPDLRVFDIIMKTKNGTTYNSYLVKDEKIAIIDTVKQKFSEQYLEHISSLVDPAKIDYIIIQHTEPDHSGSLNALLEAAPHAKVVCAKVAVKYVNNILNKEVDLLPVEKGTTIDLGQKTLSFVSSPFLHWPDTMMTFIEKERILFPCDVFASHFCDSRMFNDVITRDFWPDFKYYFDMIMRPYKKQMRNAFKKLQPLTIETIAPSHGPILRSEVDKYFKAYEEWTAPKPENNPKKLLIYYASAHGNTEKMAFQIKEGAISEGVYVDLYHVTDIDIEDHIDRIENADAILFGSPTINNDAVKPIWDILNSLATIDVKGKIGASFGSIGWSGEAIGFLDNRMASMKIKVPVEGLSVTLVPSEADLERCYHFGKQIAQEL